MIVTCMRFSWVLIIMIIVCWAWQLALKWWFPFLFLSMMKAVNMMIWNCRGAAKKGFVGLIKDLRKRHAFSLLVLLETRVSGIKAKRIANKFGFTGMFRVDPNGLLEGFRCFGMIVNGRWMLFLTLIRWFI